MNPPGSSSIFSQKLDRVAFTAYFLGAVLPLVALAFVAERFVFPTLSDRFSTWGLIAVLVSLAVLSLGSFLVIRRTTRESLRRMDRDNHRLGALLEASSELTGMDSEGESAAATVRCALGLSGARAAFLYVRGGKNEPAEVIESAGEGVATLREELEPQLSQLVSLVVTEGRPVVHGRGDGNGLPAAVILPLPGEREPMGALAAIQTAKGEDFEPAQVDALSTLSGLAAVALHNADLRDAQRNFFSHMTDMLVTALDSHLGYHKGHGGRVARLANRLGRELGLDDHRLQHLHFAALLHDIGLLKIDKSLQKNSKVCEKHAAIGYKMLGRIRLWEEVAPIVLHHHEWWNGHGYPEKLAGEAIPLESRIISVCDAYDTITSVTSYKMASTHRDAMQELARAAGTQFDPDIVDAFERLSEAGVIEEAA